MKIDIIASAMPPRLDGIGDYTSKLSERLAISHDVRVLTASNPGSLPSRGGEASGDYTPIEGVEIVTAFAYARRASVLRIADAVAERQPDCVLLQYTPFSYGRWGLNPFLPMAMRRIRRACPSTHIAVMVHEPFVPVLDVKHAVMTTWQRWQLWALGRGADTVFFSIEPWVETFRSWFPADRVRHLPIASNIPVARQGGCEAQLNSVARQGGCEARLVDSDRDALRLELGIAPSTIVLGLFGQAHSACLLDRVKNAWMALDSRSRAVVLYVGPQVQRVKDALPDVRLISTGALDAADVSRHLAAMDIFLSPFVDGVSTRRGSMMAALAHGLPVVGTVAHHTDTILRRASGESLLLTPVNSSGGDEGGRHDKTDIGGDAFVEEVLRLAADPNLRHRMGENGREFYHRHFSWERIAEAIVEAAGRNRSRARLIRTKELAAK